MAGGNPKKGVLSLVATAREPRAYEIMAIFLPELADEDLTAQLDRAGEYITNVGGMVKEVLTDSPWGRRRLAYPIRFNSEDFRDGYYAVYHFDLVPSAVSDVERELKLDTRVMRYLVVHDDPKAGEKNTGRPGGEAGAEESPERDAPGSTVPESGAVATAAAPLETAEPASNPGEAPSATAESETAPDEAAAASAEAAAPAPVEAPAPEDPAPDPRATAAPSGEDNASQETSAEEEAATTMTEDAPADPKQED